MHKTICSDCGNECEVPFKPTGDKPVYCNDCFGGSKGRDFGSNKPDKSKEKHDAIIAKLDKILRALEVISPKKTFIVEKPDTAETSSDAVETPRKASPEKIKEKKTAKKTPAKKAAKKKAPAKKATKKKVKKAK